MIDTEQLAVSAVSSEIARCARLSGYVDSNDKTPITDGHIDIYKGTSKKKNEILGRVPVQVKGRSQGVPAKASRQTIGFSVDKSDLVFFHTHGGGLYFYVPMFPDGTSAQVYYAILSPFKINRLLSGKRKKAKTLTVQFSLLPESTAGIENVVEFAHNARNQRVIQGATESLLDTAQSITIQTLTAISDIEPTNLSLDTTDYAVTVKTSAGLVIPVDIDLTVFPEEYVPRPVPTLISAGEVTFAHNVAQRLSEDTFRITCSPGVHVILTLKKGQLETNVKLSLAGHLREQLRDVEFFTSLADGNPLRFDDTASEPKSDEIRDRRGLDATRRALEGMLRVYEYFGLGDSFIATIMLTLDDKRLLLTIGDAFLHGADVSISGEGTGRWDITLGNYKIIGLITEGTSNGKRALLDPLDPARRGLLRLVSSDESKEAHWATVYESLSRDDFLTTLNLHLDKIVEAYDALEDKRRYGLANSTVLKLISASDISDGPRRSYLLDGAWRLNDWIMRHEDDDHISKVNGWQIQARHRPLGLHERQEVAKLKRSLTAADLRNQLEACLTILLRQEEELYLIMGDMSKTERQTLQSWPIWELTKQFANTSDFDETPPVL